MGIKKIELGNNEVIKFTLLKLRLFLLKYLVFLSEFKIKFM